MEILKALSKKGIVDGGELKKTTKLESSEICKYTHELVGLGAIEKIINFEGERPKNKITVKGKETLKHMKELHKLMGDA